MQPRLSRIMLAAGLLVAAGCGNYEVAPLPAPGGDSGSGILLSLLLLAVFAACVGFLHNEGIWSNAIRLVNLVTAGLLTMNFFEPVARWLAEKYPAYTVVFDYLAFWGAFIAFYLVFREVTDRVCRVKVRFLKIADRVGGAVLSAWIGWLMVCLTLTSLHTAPLARNFLSGGFRGGEKMFFGLMAPDLQWLGFTQRVSQEVFSTSPGAAEPQGFDPAGEFVRNHDLRRANLETYIDATGKLLVNPEIAKGQGVIVQ